jgi:hypothetical protein
MLPRMLMSSGWKMLSQQKGCINLIMVQSAAHTRRLEPTCRRATVEVEIPFGVSAGGPYHGINSCGSVGVGIIGREGGWRRELLIVGGHHRLAIPPARHSCDGLAMHVTKKK